MCLPQSKKCAVWGSTGPSCVWMEVNVWSYPRYETVTALCHQQMVLPRYLFLKAWAPFSITVPTKSSRHCAKKLQNGNSGSHGPPLRLVSDLWTGCSSFNSAGRSRAMEELRGRDRERKDEEVPWGEVQKIHRSRRKSQELETCEMGRGKNIGPASIRTLSNFASLLR